jgi:hypothetical protein
VVVLPTATDALPTVTASAPARTGAPVQARATRAGHLPGAGPHTERRADCSSELEDRRSCRAPMALDNQRVGVSCRTFTEAALAHPRALNIGPGHSCRACCLFPRPRWHVCRREGTVS